MLRRLREHQPPARLPAADGRQALDFVRFRHTDSDLYRLARQQQFVRAFKEQVAQQLRRHELPSRQRDHAATSRSGEGGKARSSGTVISLRALRVRRCPRGHLFQDKIENVTGLRTSCTRAAVRRSRRRSTTFAEPGRRASSKAANAAALGQQGRRQKTPPPPTTTVTVLNGNGVAGAAANASLPARAARLPDRCRRRTAPSRTRRPQTYFHSQIYYDPAPDGLEGRGGRAAEAARSPPTCELPLGGRELRALDPGAMLIVVVGQTFHGTIAPRAGRRDARSTQPAVRSRRHRRRAPTLLRPRRSEGDVPADGADDPRAQLVPRHARRRQAVARLLDRRRASTRPSGSSFRTGAAASYWGIEETDWDDAPVLADRSFHRTIKRPRRSTSTTRARTCTWSCCARTERAYWVVNTLLDSLSNETMLAIAKGLKPLTRASRVRRDGEGSASSAPAGSASSPARASPSSATTSSSATSSRRRSTPSRRGEVPFHENGVAGAARSGTRERLTFTLDVARRSPAASSSSSASTRRRPTRATPTSRASGRSSTSCPSSRAGRSSS